MTDKEFRGLSKADLIEIIYKQKQEEEALRKELEEAKAKLKSRELKIEDAGSIAEAALSVNEVFEAAQKAADDYLNQIKASNADIENRCTRMLEETEEKCKKMELETDEKIKSKWLLFQKKAQEVISAHDELSTLLKP